MSDFFQIPLGDEEAQGFNDFENFGLDGNPFPEVGLESGVLYSGHMTGQLRRVNLWINNVGEATDPDHVPPNASIPPLAVYGSLGVGKTHLLRTLERGLSRNQKMPVLRKGLTDEGMTRFVLANLFLRYLPHSELDQDPSTGLIRKIVGWLREVRTPRQTLRDTLGAASPIYPPFEALLRRSIEREAILWLSRWLRREYTTPTQRSKLGLAGVLESEGQAVRAVADLLRLARAADLVQVWFVMIDQLEELWREGVITPSRRARFLTDLRLLVDQALEGAPIALLLAWAPGSERGLNVGDLLKRDYQALWERLGEPVNLPTLEPDDVWPFAAEYLKAADVTQKSSEGRRRLYRRLERSCDAVLETLRSETKGPDFFPPRRVLRIWRTTAEGIARAVPG